jgi:hypothetical protein
MSCMSQELSARITARLPDHLRDRVEQRARLESLETENFFELLLDAAIRAHEDGSLKIGFDDPCESPRLVRDQLGESRVGIVVSGDAHDIADAEAVVREELEREGLPTELGATREYAIGRGYGITTLLLVAGGVVAFFAGVKSIDDGIPVLRKWWRALSTAGRRLGASGYTANFIKMVCIEKALEAGTQPADLDTERITATIHHADIEVEADVMLGHWTVTIPTNSGSAFVFVVGQDGEIYSFARLGYPKGQEVLALPPREGDVDAAGS